ncbi:phosphotransferase [Actinomadura sp. PM05-2]|uniref:Maltokinase n=1 Tax=Actinomadura parmotrematis TaxID=2864039 RepID=A0ABS7FVL1_9ACTN|nr:phosphotransferase [Actinomadura parmotrematis]
MRPLPERSLEDLLLAWLPRQRWFAGKDRPVDEVAVASGTVLRDGDPGLRHLVLDVRQGAAVDRYQLLAGIRRDPPERLRQGGIGAVPGGFAYDAAHDPELTGTLLAAMAAGAVHGPLRFHRAEGASIDTGLTGKPATGEQSNTSLVYGQDYICKLFRRLAPGVSPDLEVNLALTGRGSPHVPPVLGWFELDRGDGSPPDTLGLMSRFLHTATDGWRLAVTSVRDWFAQPVAPRSARTGAGLDAGGAGGDFAGEAERLGAATAEVHRDLAAAFGVTEVGGAELRALAAGMHGQLAEVAASVPELKPHEAAIGTAFDALARLDGPLPFQRVHGDYHLGQVLRSESGWVLLDFEGEPARTPEERAAPGHALRDVAGMLRSFEYAARFLHADEQHAPPGTARELELRARAWAGRNRRAFCRGYAAAGGADPDAHAALLRALELDKAVYEIRYEAANRPSWLPVPLRSLAGPDAG